VDEGKKVMKLKALYHKLSPQQRLHQTPVPIIGLTGGIGTGKSTVAELLKKKGLPLIDADQLVKGIYSAPNIIATIKGQLPEVVQDGKIDFPLLREKVFSDPKIKLEIEALIYAHLPAAFSAALDALGSANFVIYDVPLLFEKKLDPLVDFNILVYAPRKIQLERILKRDGSSQELANQMLDSQMDIESKRTNADYIINNDGTLEHLAEEVETLLRQIFD
jgi:dephospho-CoA kinase